MTNVGVNKPVYTQTNPTELLLCLKTAGAGMAKGSGLGDQYG